MNRLNIDLSSCRDNYLDFLKGLLIFLVVYGHVIQYFGYRCTDEYFKDFFFKLIYIFHMPMFMLISGYLSFFSIMRYPLPDLIYRRALQLLLPVLSWGIFVGIQKSIFKIATANANFDVIFDFVFSEILSNLWFLWVLFLNYLVLFVSMKFSKRFEEVFMIVCLIVLYFINYIIGFKYLGIGLLCWYLPFYVMGYICNKYIEKIHKPLYFIGYISLILFPVLAFYWSRVGITPLAGLAPALQGLISFCHRFVTGITGILASYVLFGWLVSHFPKRMIALDRLGGITLEVYCMHYYFLYLIVLLSGVVLPVKIVLTFIFALTGSIILKKIIYRSPKATRLLFNKKI